MNTNHTNTTNSKSMKEQVLQDIEKVKEDINTIKNRMTPGQIIDDALYSKQNLRDPAVTFELLKNNPVGTTFLTIGTLLLTEYQNQGTFESRAKTRASSLSSQVSEKVGHLKDNVTQIKQKASALKEEQVSQTKSTFASGKEKVQAQGQHLKQIVKDVNPLAYIALGAGLGAMTGAALPVTQVEEKIGLEVGEKLSSFRSELKDAVNESINVFKNEFIGELTDFKMNLF